MSTTEQRRRLDVPATLLGWDYHTWTRTQIRLILDHYKWNYDEITRTKRNLMHELHLLVQEFDLDRADRMEIVRASKNGKPLPRCKPRVRTVPHPIFPDRKGATRREFARNGARIRRLRQPAVAAIIAAAPQVRSDANLPTPIPNIPSALPRDCVVCFETLSPQNSPKRKITSLCNHEPEICTSCLTESISTQFSDKVWDQIDCPICGQRLQFQDVKAFADPATFGRSGLSCKLNLKKFNVL